MPGGEGLKFLVVKTHIPLVAAEEIDGGIAFIIDSPDIVFACFDLIADIVYSEANNWTQEQNPCGQSTTLSVK